MKRKMTQVLSVLLAVLMLFGMALPDTAYAEEEADEEEVQAEQEMQKDGKEQTDSSESSTDSAPEGYAGENTFLNKNQIQMFRSGEEDTPKVLLIEDVDPWDSQANQIVLGSLTEYDKVTTSEFLNVNLEEYGVIVFGNDQPFSTYDNYKEFKEYMELFASIGGVIVFGACDDGWADGIMTSELPGGVTKNNHYEYRNYIADASHPIVTGELTDGIALTDDELYSNYCSHISFNEDSFPAGTRVILRETSSDQPTLIEYPLGKGRVIASGLTWEHNYVHYDENSSYGCFAKRSLDDLYKYAIRISNIDVDELQSLEDWRLKRNAHSVIAADASSDETDLQGIPGATASIDGAEYTADENGQIFYNGPYGEKTVTVKAEGYRTNSIYYNVKARNSQIFFMEKDTGDGLPYVVMASGQKGSGEYLDLRSQTLHFTEDKGTKLTLKMDADWGTHGKGTFQIYQAGSDGRTGKILQSADGNIEFAPGKVFNRNKTVKLQLVAEDGTRSEAVDLKIVIDKAVQVNESSDTALTEGITKFDWLGNYPVKSDNEIFTKLLTSDMSISSEFIPAEISADRNDDGTITYKIVIGIASGDATKNILHSKAVEQGFKGESEWSTFKQEIKRYKEAGNPAKYWEKLEKKYAKDLHPTKLRATGEVDVSVCGYGEVKVDQNDTIISGEGGLIVNGGAKFVLGKTFMAGPVPMYFEFTGGVGAEISAGLEYTNEDGQGLEFGPKFNGITLKLPDITLGGGVGVRGVATAGIEGNGKLSMAFLNDGINSTGNLKLGGAVHIKVLFIADYNWPFYNTDISLWSASKSRMLATAGSSDAVSDQLSFVSREYLEQASEWNGKMAATARNAWDSGQDEQILQEGVMPDSMPRIHKIGDKLVMLFLRDAAERDAQNYTQLVYSVFDGNTWSDPKAVWESDTADYFFDSRTVGDQLYVAWQKAGEQLDAGTPEEAVEQAAENSEICFAVWNAQTDEFVDQQYITDNDKMDVYPSIAADEENVTVVWAENDENDVTGEEGTYTIYKKEEDEQESRAEKIAETSDYIVEMSAGYADGSLEVLTNIAKEGEDTDICRVEDGELAAVDSGKNFSGLEFETDSFLWASDGSIRQYIPETGTTGSVDTGVYASSYRYISNGSKTAIVYTEPVVSDDEDSTVTGTALKAVMYENGEWSDAPITVLENENDSISFMDAAILENGEFAAIMNVANYGDTGDLERTALEFAVVQPEKDLELNYADVDKADPEAGTQTLYYNIKNHGDSTVSDIHLTVSDADGSIYADKQLDVTIPAGEELMLSEELDVSGIQSAGELTVLISSSDEKNTENNSLSIAVGQVDVSLSVESYEKGDKVYFVVSASNDAQIPANAAISMTEDSADGIVLDVKNIGTIGQGETVEHPYVLDKSKIDFDESGQKTYYFKVETKETDWNEEDNDVSYVVSQNLTDSGNLTDDFEEVEVIEPERVVIREGDLSFESTESESVTLHTDIYPENASVSEVEWIVEDADIVYVDPDGTVTPLRAGQTTIKAVLTGTVMDEINVTVGGSGEGHVHNLIFINETEPTCCSTGNIAYWHCEECGLNFKDGAGSEVLQSVVKAINPDNHAGGTEIRNAVAATAEKDGYTGDVYCLGCGQMIRKGEVIGRLTDDDQSGTEVPDSQNPDKTDPGILSGSDESGKTQADSVKTGDLSSYYPCLVLLLASAGIITAVVSGRKRIKR